MQPLLRVLALGAFVCLVNRRAMAETPGPPDWRDNAPSVYSAGPRNESAAPNDEVARGQQVIARKMDAAVVPSAHEEAVHNEEPVGRRLAPPSAPIKAAGDTTDPQGQA